MVDPTTSPAPAPKTYTYDAHGDRLTASNGTTVQTLTTDPDAGTLVYNHHYNDSDEKNGCV